MVAFGPSFDMAPMQHCLRCASNMEQSFGVGTAAVKPVSRAFMVCAYCGFVMGVKPDGTLRALTKQESRRAGKDAKLQAVKAAIGLMQVDKTRGN